MDDNGSNKSNKIWQVVKLKEILQKWQSVALGPKDESLPSESDQSHSGISPLINNRLRKATAVCDSDEEGCHSPEPPPDVPEGYLAVYVGPELRRFIIPTVYLSHHVFKLLLEKAEEEFGFDHNGGLTIPIEIETFKYLLKCIENHYKAPSPQRTAGESLQG